jgi:hypothetical protein
MAAMPREQLRVPRRDARWRLWAPLCSGAAAAALLAMVWVVWAPGPVGGPADPKRMSVEVSPHHVLGSHGANFEETRVCDIVPPLPS